MDVGKGVPNHYKSGFCLLYPYLFIYCYCIKLKIYCCCAKSDGGMAKEWSAEQLEIPLGPMTQARAK